MLHSLVVVVSALPARPEDYQKKQEKGVRGLDMLLPLLLVLALKVVWYWSEIGDKSNFIFVVNAIVNMLRQLVVLIWITEPLLSEPAGNNERRKRQTKVLFFMRVNSWSREELRCFCLFLDSWYNRRRASALIMNTLGSTACQSTNAIMRGWSEFKDLDSWTQKGEEGVNSLYNHTSYLSFFFYTSKIFGE